MKLRKTVAAAASRRPIGEASSPKGPAEVIQIGIESGIEDTGPLSLPMELSSDQCNAYRQCIKVCGLEVTTYLKSVKWQHRIEGIALLKHTLHEIRNIPKKVILETILLQVKILIEDSVIQVYRSTVGLVRYLMISLINDMLPEDVQPAMAYPVPALIYKLGDMNARVRELALDLLLEMSSHSCLGVSFIASLVSPCTPAQAASSSYWKYIIGILNLLSALVASHPLSTDDEDDKFSVHSVMTIALQGLNVTSNKVRKTAISVVVQVYRKVGANCEAYLNGINASIVKQLKQDIEREGLSDLNVLQIAATRGEEEEDHAHFCLEERTLTPEQNESIDRWQALLGSNAISCIHSKKWRLRDRVFERLRAQIKTAIDIQNQGQESNSNSQSQCNEPSLLSKFYDPRNYQLTRAVFESLMEIVEKGLGDAIPQLIMSCILFMRSVLDLYIPVISVEHLQWHIKPVVQKLVTHVSGTTSTVTRAALEMMQHLSKSSKLGVKFISEIVVCPDTVPKVTSGNVKEGWKVTLARLMIVNDLVKEYSFCDEELSVETVMHFSAGSFQSPSGKVRSAAVAVIIEVYKKCGNVIRSYLRYQKPAILNDLKERIAKLARKDRTKSAPIQTLASIVQPLGVEDELEKVLPTRPSTFPAALEIDEEIPTVSITSRISKWKRQQNGEEQPAPTPPTSFVLPSTGRTLSHGRLVIS